MGTGKSNEFGSTDVSRRWLYAVALVAQGVGVLAIVLLFLLITQCYGGFGWGYDVGKLENNHVMLMTIGMIIFFGDALLVYRVCIDMRKITAKILHACLLAASFSFALLGLVSIYLSKTRSKQPQAHLQSLHAWMGLFTIVLFVAQWVCGFVAYLFPKLDEGIRASYMPSHKLWGKYIFIFALITVMMGATEYGIFYGTFYGAASRRLLLNAFAFCILAFALLILYLVGNPGFQRPSEDTHAEHIPLVDK